MRDSYPHTDGDGHNVGNALTHAYVSTGRFPRAVDTGCAGND